MLRGFLSNLSTLFHYDFLALASMARPRRLASRTGPAGAHAELEPDPAVDPESRRLARWVGVVGCCVGLGRLDVDARKRRPAYGSRCRRRVDARCALGWLCQACLGL